MTIDTKNKGKCRAEERKSLSRTIENANSDKGYFPEGQRFNSKQGRGNTRRTKANAGKKNGHYQTEPWIMSAKTKDNLRQ